MSRRNPRDGSVLDAVEPTPADELPAMVARARAAQAKFAKESLERRAAIVRAFARALLQRGDTLRDRICEETGKPEAEAWLHEIVPIADLRDYWCGDGLEHLSATEPYLSSLSYPGKRALIERVPRGVVGLIAPWNFPLALPLRTIFPALVAGNAVILKPSEVTPGVGTAIGAAAKGVLPDDLLQVAVGDGAIGEALIAAEPDAVVFTGSVPTGKRVAAQAAEALIPVGLELGGKDAALVLDDAPLERAARGIVWAGFANAGQNCAAVERVYVVESVAKEFRRRVSELSKELRLGPDVGPLATEAQRDTVRAQLEEADGAEVLAGGTEPERDGFWHAPTVVVSEPNDIALLREETFGPVLTIVEVADEAEAIARANESRYGLTASVWTRSVRRGKAVGRQLAAGVVTINDHAFSGAVPSLPWSGVKASGSGITNSPATLDLLTRPRALVVDGRRFAKREVWWFPYTDGLVDVGRHMATLRGGGSPLERVRAFFGLVGAFLRRWRV
ncbi:MAG: aldehyde dehydrogenase family protein [Myxococcota bacterium]